MQCSRQVFLAVFTVIFLCVVTATGSQESDRAAAERIFGPGWQQLSRHAGMIFTGTVLNGRIDAARMDRPVPSIALRFRIDRAIVGVEPGQILTIHEWTGAWSQQKPMRPGEHFLLFLYAPSHLGLTSPVDGARGQIQLDATGQYAIGRRPASPVSIAVMRLDSSPSSASFSNATAAVEQLARAIRSARGN
jgi:hypothetical protein